MICADVEPAHVVAHDDEDVGFLLLLRGCWCRCHHHGGKRNQQTEPERLNQTHGLAPSCMTNQSRPAADGPSHHILRAATPRACRLPWLRMSERSVADYANPAEPAHKE